MTKTDYPDTAGAGTAFTTPAAAVARLEELYETRPHFCGTLSAAMARRCPTARFAPFTQKSASPRPAMPRLIRG